MGRCPIVIIMNVNNYFFLIFFLTVIVTRLLLYLKPLPSPTIKGFRLHHYMFGVVLIPVAILLNTLELYAVGFGLFMDELTYLLIGGKNHRDNYSISSLVGTVLFVILVFIFREKFLTFL